jgi:homopolymeric O-antigen transport system ATP-binding protein
MSAELAIKAESVGKRYWLGTGHHEDSLGYRLEQLFRAPFRRALGRDAPVPAHDEDEFWALRGVSLELPKGEILGMIGPNGSGKSTLLKMFSNITPPTEGKITLRGRVGTLLEVGTGFHPELTGRENVYLNGSILGMRRREIDALFDEIVEFSGIEQFLDTPVKRYSSGMFVRLAFAVAAHLDTEILLVDEVLAVGDTEFQRKCLGKIDDVARGGRTIIFVSHNLTAVQRLCTRTIWLEKGRMVDNGPTHQVVADYLKQVGPRQAGGVATIPDDVQRVGSGEALLRQVAMTDRSGRAINRLELGQPFSIGVKFDVIEPIPDAVVEIGIETADGSRLLTSLSTDDGPSLSLAPGSFEISADLDLTLLPGELSITVGIYETGRFAFDYVERALSFAAVNISHQGSPRHPWEQGRPSVRPRARWTLSGERAAREVAPASGQPAG